MDHLKGIADVLARRQPATLVILPDIPDRRVHPGLLGVDGADAILDGLLAKECFLCDHPRANPHQAFFDIAYFCIGFFSVRFI